VRAPHHEIVRAFAAIAPLQPTDWTSDGLVCAPRAAPEIAGPALRTCPLPVEPLEDVPGWPTPHSLMVSGWYRRSSAHAPGPHGVSELIQTDGDGFGPLGHPTTAMCLEGLRHLPAAPALDAGCGSGLLSQAWVCCTGLPVRAIDADAATVSHARSSVAAAGLADMISVERTQISAVESDAIEGHVILANIPAEAHTALVERVEYTPPGVLLSGITRTDAEPVIQAWMSRGMRMRRAAQCGRWRCFSLVNR